MHLRRTSWIGLSLVAVSMVTLAGWTIWFHSRTWCPVDMPVSLSQGKHISTGEFAINLNARYAIEISAKGEIPVDQLGCMLGNDMRATCPMPSVVRAHWTLLSKGNVTEGTSDDSKGGGAVYSTGEAFRSIGFFQGEKGQTYKLDVDVLADGSSLLATDPHLRVTVFDTNYESGLVLSGLLRLICLIIGVIGAALFLGSIFVQRRNSHSSATLPTS